MQVKKERKKEGGGKEFNHVLSAPSLALKSSPTFTLSVAKLIIF
jgi:hypothetical protein